jgi:hypothetical protein
MCELRFVAAGMLAGATCVGVVGASAAVSPEPLAGSS